MPTYIFLPPMFVQYLQIQLVGHGNVYKQLRAFPQIPLLRQHQPPLVLTPVPGLTPSYAHIHFSYHPPMSMYMFMSLCPLPYIYMYVITCMLFTSYPRKFALLRKDPWFVNRVIVFLPLWILLGSFLKFLQHLQWDQ